VADARILLAEDHLASQKVAAAVIQKLGFQVDVVANGAEAVHAAAPGRYLVILMDCQLPLLNGFEATSEIRRLQGKAGHTPIIAVTVAASESDRERCRAAGMDDFLAKPLSRHSLAATLERWAPDAGQTAALTSTYPLPPVGVSAASSDHPYLQVLDPLVIVRLERLGRASGINLMEQLAELYLEDADAIIIELRRAFVVDDSTALALAVHALGSASANLGAAALTALCRDWEAQIIPGELVGDRDQLYAVEAALELVRPALEPYVSSAP
jgi:CheY-like chemotaxis protein/HPt (histidine-containing phosphotransfer) domain-containing protein